jgi:hypothetical protein
VLQKAGFSAVVLAERFDLEGTKKPQRGVEARKSVEKAVAELENGSMAKISPGAGQTELGGGAVGRTDPRKTQRDVEAIGQER